MELGTRAIVLWLWVLFTVVVGVGIVLYSGPMLLTMVGIVAIIIGLISLMPALMYTLEEEEDSPSENERPA